MTETLTCKPPNLPVAESFYTDVMEAVVVETVRWVVMETQLWPFFSGYQWAWLKISGTLGRLTLCHWFINNKKIIIISQTEIEPCLFISSVEFSFLNIFDLFNFCIICFTRAFTNSIFFLRKSAFAYLPFTTFFCQIKTSFKMKVVGEGPEKTKSPSFLATAALLEIRWEIRNAFLNYSWRKWLPLYFSSGLDPFP